MKKWDRQANIRSFKGEYASSTEAVKFANECLVGSRCDDNTKNIIDSVIDDVVTNIVEYAHTDFEMEVNVTRKGVMLTFTDYGERFDPTLHASEQGMTDGRGDGFDDDVEIGGLGIKLVMELMDDVSYSYRDGCNVLSLIKYFKKRPEGQNHGIYSGIKTFRNSISLKLFGIISTAVLVTLLLVAIAGVIKTYSDVQGYYDQTGYLLAAEAADIMDIYLGDSLDNIDDIAETDAERYLRRICTDTEDVIRIYVEESNDGIHGREILTVTDAGSFRTDVPFDLTENEKKLFSGEVESTQGGYTLLDQDCMSYLYAIADDSSEEKIICAIGVDFVIENIKNSQLIKATPIIAVMLVSFIAITICIIVAVKSMILNPVMAIRKGMKNLVNGMELTADYLPAHGKDEISQMTRDYNTMLSRLHKYINDRERLSKEKREGEAEISFAAQIQMGMLPAGTFDNDAVSVRARITPALSVGGDMFYYFELEDGRLCMFIADVSGEGLAAAMFMGSAVTSIRYNLLRFGSPAKALTAASADLEAHNPEQLFVTAFVAIYDKASHTLCYSNAGHNYPYLLSAGSVRQLTGAHGVLMGLLEDEEYNEDTISVAAGDKLFMYTDGVVEAMDKTGQQFNDERLVDALSSYNRSNNKPGANHMSLVDEVDRRLTIFKDEAKQNDDITMMEVEFK